jgi:putative ABC transport system permease protein
MLGTFIQDLRYSLRGLLKNPAFTLIAAGTLALGIGANTAVFSLLNAVLLRPLPYTNPDGIVTVWSSFPQAGIHKFGVAYKNVSDWKERNHVFAPLAIYQAASNTTLNLTGVSGPLRVQGARATGDFFQVLNVRPLYGRAIFAEDEEPGRDHVAVLGYNLWWQYFGGDAQIVGTTVKLNDEDYLIVGIMPPGFQFPSGQEMPAGQQFASATEIWTPLQKQTAAIQNDRVTNSFRAVARLKPGIRPGQAQSEMSLITRHMVSEHFQDLQGLEVLVSTMKENQVGELRPALLILVGAVAFVLLIACANIANLLLSRSTARQREFIVRAALGASRGRIIQQLLTDSLMLACLGGGLGLGLALLANRILVAFGPADIPRLADVGLDLRVLSFTIVISALTGFIFGVAPAIQVSGFNLQEGMKAGGRSIAGASHGRLRGLLVVSQVMLVFLLLVAAGLMLKSYRKLMEVAPGIDANHVLTARVALAAHAYPHQKKLTFYRDLLDGLSHGSAVRSAAIVRDLPFSGTDPRYAFTVEGRPLDVQNGGYTFRYRIISPDYFKTMGIPLLSGRFFDTHDDENAMGAVIINQTAAKQVWPGQNPLGQVVVAIGNIAPARAVVVGVVGDVRFGGLDTDSDIEVYFSYPQIPEGVSNGVIGSMAVVARTGGAPENLAPVIRRTVASLDKDIPVSSVVTMKDLELNSAGSRKFQMTLLGTFAAIALALAIVGIYGVISYWVVQRTKEIGIRIAIGAESRDVLRLVVGKGMMLAMAGLALGIAAGFALTRLMSGLLFGVAPTDAPTFVIAGVLLTSTALAACGIPAWRATRVNPITALRIE